MAKLRPIDRRALGKALLVFAALLGLFLPVYVRYELTERQARKLKLDFAAQQVASRFEALLLARSEHIRILADLAGDAGGFEAALLDRVRTVELDVPGFLAINLVDPNGVIRHVHPAEVNDSALGQNLLTRDDVGRYLEEARASRAPRLTHVVSLYQGGKGFAVYAAAHTPSGRFLGWVNGVFRAVDFVEALAIRPGLEGFGILVGFAGETASPILEHGVMASARSDGLFGRDSRQLLNQTLEVAIRPHDAPQWTDDAQLIWRGIGLGLVLAAGLVSVFAYLLGVSNAELRRRFEKERLQGNLLNLLVHDILNPLLIVRYSVEAARRVATPAVEQHLAKTVQGMEQLSDVITRVRDLRALELGKLRTHVEPVPVNDIILQTFETFEPRFREKGLAPRLALEHANPEVLVDRALFQNNVVNNLVSNAVKFSEPGGPIEISASVAPGEVVLRVSDKGVGMPESIRRNLFMEHVDISKPGTIGELGTGIGMLQVASYVRFFGGRVDVRSRWIEEAPDDHGTTFEIRLPLAAATSAPV